MHTPDSPEQSRIPSALLHIVSTQYVIYPRHLSSSTPKGHINLQSITTGAPMNTLQTSTVRTSAQHILCSAQTKPKLSITHQKSAKTTAIWHHLAQTKAKPKSSLLPPFIPLAGHKRPFQYTTAIDWSHLLLPRAVKVKCVWWWLMMMFCFEW